MANSIFERQNHEHNLELLVAQRHLYDKAKQNTSIRFITAIITAMVFPALKIMNFWETQGIEIGMWISLASGILSLFIISFLKRRSKEDVETAAKIQEEFDTNVFGLDWNDELLKGEANPEAVSRANRDFKGDRTKLKDWYSSTPGVKEEFAILLSQRSNLTWDAAQRKYYANALYVVMIVLLLITLVAGCAKGISLFEYVAYVLAPLLSLFKLGIDARDSHKKIYEAQERKESEIASIIKDYRTDPEAITKTILRTIQNSIYTNRKEQALVPNFIYKNRRDDAQDEMKDAIDTIIRKQQS